MALNLFAISVHAIGVLLVALLLWQLQRAVGGRFLTYWASGWVALTAALLALRVAVLAEAPAAGRTLGLVGYCLGEYLFGFLLWAGFRDYAGRPLERRHVWWAAPFAAFGVAAPLEFPHIATLFVVHAPVFAAFFGLSLAVACRCRPAGDRPSVGLAVARLALSALLVLFLVYGPVTFWAVYVANARPTFMNLSPVYDAVLELALAFGMVVLATERVRDDLEEKNRRLEEATRQLAETARTDALTGLLNRSAFESLLADKAGTRFAGCLAVLDLNDLKRLNDRHLHAAGDAALKIVARALRNKFRVTDPLFRVGGDEFVVLVPNGTPTDLAGRLTAADGDLADQRIPGVDVPTTLCVAWGVAAFASGDELTDAYQRADRAMYADKARRKGDRLAVAGS